MDLPDARWAQDLGRRVATLERDHAAMAKRLDALEALLAALLAALR